jgi:acetyltransferase-like isoleucine patch superfamily enzyme
MLYQRVIGHIKKGMPADIIRKTIHYSLEKITHLFAFPVKQFRAWLYFKNRTVSLGKGVLLKGLTYNVRVGKYVNIYDHCIIEVAGDGPELVIGDHCLFAYGVLLSCTKRIRIGNYVMIGEYTSVRDTSHTYSDQNKTIKENEDVSSPVEIGNDVWIGRGCLILGGTIIEDGVVVAANSVVKGRLEKYGIYGGAPARLLKMRNTS